MYNKTYYIICCWLFDDRGEKLTKGGSQRYVIELINMLKEQHYNVIVLQKASADFDQRYLDTPVKGIKVPSGWYSLFLFSKKVYEIVPSDAYAIYVYQEAAFPYICKNSITIQHGLNWNASELKKKFLNTYVLQPFILRRVSKVVCVDTAYINWVLTQVTANIGIKNKLCYIPNFVDSKSFIQKNNNKFRVEDKIILFPRRIEEHRGALLMYDAMKNIWAKGYKYKLIYCGSGSAYEKLCNKITIDNTDEFISIIEKDFDEMPDIYNEAHVSVIPTLDFEGTSLSCIESMSCGVPVVVTNVGGLCNLVIPRFNGLVTQMDANDLSENILKLLSDESLYTSLMENALKTAKALDISVWKQKWLNILFD